MQKILSFVMVVAMALSLSAFAPMTTKKVAHKAMPRIEQKAPVAPASQSARLATPQARKAMATAMALQTKKQQPQVKHVAKKNIVRKAVNAVTEITPEQALEIGKALADNATTDVEYRVVGIVSYANDYNTQYGSQTFSMSSDGSDSKSNFKAYQCNLAAPGVVVGDSVAVTGKILKYVSGSNTTIEIKQGTVEILGGDVPPTPPTPAGDVITPEQALEIGKALADNATTDVEYRVVGIVSYANDYNTQYGSQTFSMSSDGSDSKSNFKAYQCNLAAPGVVVGDSVAVTGKILKYVSGSNTTIEIKQGTVEILGGDVPPTPPTGDVEITGLQLASAYYVEGFWDFDIYADDATDYFPEVYFSVGEEATSETSIVGTWSLYWGGYWKTANDSVLADEEEPVGSLTITCVEQGIYNFVGSFVGTDGKTYTWNAQNIEVYALDGETEEEITLTDGGEPVPPTPGDIYTIAEVKSLHAEGAIENEDVISVKGYVAGMFLKPSNFEKFGSVCVWLTDTKGGSAKELELYNCYGLNEDKFTSFSPDATGDKNVDVTSVSTATYSLNVGDYVEATGAFNLFNTTYELNTGCYLTKIGSDTPVPPTPGEKYEVDMNADFEVSVEDFLGWFTIVDATVTASNDSIDFTAMVYSFEKEAFYGVEWSGEELECEFVLNGVEQTITSATLLATQEGDVTKATVVLVIASGAQYTLNLTYVIPEPKETVNVDYPQGVMGEYYPSYGDYYFYAENEGENIMILDIFTSNLEGTYTMEDMDMSYTGFAKVNGADTTWVAPYSIDATITNVEDTFRIAVDFFGKDTINYHITSWYVAPAAKDTVTLNYANALYEDALEAYESAMAYGENTNDFIQLYFAEIAQVAGDFTLADLYADYSYIGLVNGTDTTYVTFTSAEINVAVNGEVATITAGLMGTDTMYYKVTMTATIEKYEVDMYQYDEEEDVKDSFNAQTDQLTWDTSYFAEYGVVFLNVVKADESANIILEFVSDVATIANGTYPIAVDGDGSFVVASAGFDEAENYDYPSYYAQYDDQYMYPWYIVSGTVTVSDEAIVVAGVNSRDKKVDITITLNGKPQPSGDHTIVIADYADVNFNTFDGAYTVVTDKNGGTEPAYNTTSLDLRLYAKNTFTLTSNNGAMTEIVFNISDKGLTRQADIAVSAGSITSYDMTNAKVTWKGNATEVVFTVGEKATHGSESTKAGQFDFTSIDIVTTATGLQDLRLNDNVKKFMYNGNVMINVNGVIYNVMGAKVAR